MRLLNVREITVGLFALLLFSGCMNNEEPTPPTYSSWGFLEINNEDYYIISDADETLKIKDPQSLDIELEDSQRVYSTFRIAEIEAEELGYDYLIELQSLIIAGYSEIQIVNEESRDTLGNGIVGVSGIWMEGNYLNMEIGYAKSDEDHIFSLSYDEENQIDGELIKLELRSYNNEDEEGETYIAKLNTFNLLELVDLADYDGENEIDFELIINRGTVNKKVYTIKYNPVVN